MLAVAAVLRELGKEVSSVATTVYVRDDPPAGFPETAARLEGWQVYYVGPGLRRRIRPPWPCPLLRGGSEKEGIGAGGAMLLASLLGKSDEEIRKTLLATVSGY